MALPELEFAHAWLFFWFVCFLTYASLYNVCDIWEISPTQRLVECAGLRRKTCMWYIQNAQQQAVNSPTEVDLQHRALYALIVHLISKVEASDK